MDAATERLIPLQGQKVSPKEPWVQNLIGTAAQIGDALEQMPSAALAGLEQEVMLLLAYNVEGDVRRMVDSARRFK